MCCESRPACVLISLLTLAATGFVGADENRTSKFAALVDQLDAPSFHSRRDATRQLIESATRSSDDVMDQVTQTLRDGLEHRSIEVRLAASEALREIEQMRRDEQTDRLLNPHCGPATIRLPGWIRFCQVAGDDMNARRLFAAVSQRYSTELRDLYSELPVHRVNRITRTLDPYRLSSEDAVGWAMLLLLDTETENTIASNLTPRIRMALSNSAMGPKIQRKLHADVLRRLIDHWVRDQAAPGAARDRMLIAMRYQCSRAATELCDQVLADASESPSTQVTALLCALALGKSDVERQARLRLTDDRTAHVWQLIASRKTRIRTQVRDVALAILLHHHGVDPRKAGFDELQADPTLVFRDHSLGFPNEASRRNSYQIAFGLLPPTNNP